MGLDPNEKNWFGKHPLAMTIIVIVFIVAVGITLKVLQQKYFFVEEREYKEHIFVNMTFDDVDKLFNMDSNLTEDEKNSLFDLDYKYNVFKWTCKPISCNEIMGIPTIKLICDDYGFTEDVRIALKNDCNGMVQDAQVTIVFQLISKTTGEYYLGRSGNVVGE